MLYRSVIVGLLARDCKEAILRNKSRIERLCAFFEDYHVVVVENDSVDGTPLVLLDWAEENRNVMVDSFTDHSIRLADCSYDRISHMAKLRNRLLDDIWQLPASDLVVMIDIDILDFNVEGVIESISHAPEDWGGLMANGRLLLPNGKQFRSQYDQFAFVACDEEMIDAIYFQHKRGRLLDKKVQKTDYCTVKSAFGGIGIYRSEAIRELQYRAVMTDDGLKNAFCEHIPFHLDIISRGYKNYVCRQMKVINGVIKVKPWVTFLMCYLPRVPEILCKISAFLYKRNMR